MIGSNNDLQNLSLGFDVVVNGNTVLQNFDIPNQIGTERAVIKSTQINVFGGKGMTIKFNPNNSGKAYLNAIRIVKLK